MIAPADYDFAGTRAISVIDPVDVQEERMEEKLDEAGDGNKAEKDLERNSADSSNNVPKAYSVEVRRAQVSREELQRVFKRAAIPSLLATLVVMIIIPLPMYFSSYIFSPGFFTFWIACSMIWALSAGGFCILLPIWESRTQMIAIAVGCVNYLREFLVDRYRPTARCS